MRHRGFTHLRHHALDKLVAAGQAPQALHIVGSNNTVGRDAPNAGALGPRLRFADEKRAHASVVVGEGTDPRAPWRQVRLAPDALIALYHIDLGQRLAVAIQLNLWIATPCKKRRVRNDAILNCGAVCFFIFQKS